MKKVSALVRKDNKDDSDKRLKLAELIIFAPEAKLSILRDLYPEYFLSEPRAGSLEYISDLNTSYLKWKEDYGISKEMITEFPTIDLYNNYMRYCLENRMLGMDKKIFYATLEYDYNLDTLPS